MDIYFVTVIVLSVGTFIHSRCSVPELRPANPTSSAAWSLLAKLTFFVWIAMMIWGFWSKPWTLPLAGLIGSLAANALVAMRGPRPFWPGLSMLLCVIGLGLSAWIIFGEPGF